MLQILQRMYIVKEIQIEINVIWQTTTGCYLNLACDFWIKIKRKVDFIYTDELICLWLFTDSDILIINCLIIKYLWIDIYRDFSTFPLYQAPNFCACAVTNAFLYIPIPTLFTYWIVSTVIHTPQPKMIT